MEKKGQITVGGIILIVIIIITSLVLVQAIFSGQTQITTKTSVVNETLNFANAISSTKTTNTSYWFTLDHGCPQTNNNWRLSDTSDCALSGISVVLDNGTSLTLNTHYKLNLTGGVGYDTCADGRLYGDIAFLNHAGVNNSNNISKVSYTYCQDGYSTNSASRTMAGLIGIFSVIALAITIMYLGLRQWF